MAARENRAARRRDARARPYERVRASASRGNCPAASSSASRWRAALRSIRKCSCSTSRSARSTRICGSTCRSRSSGWSARIRRHHHPGHPRPGRGAVDGGPHRGDVARPYRTGLVADRDLRRTEDACSSTNSSAPPTCLSGEFSRKGDACPRHARRGGIGIDVPSKSASPTAARSRSRYGQSNCASCPSGGLAGTVKAVMPLGAHVIYEIEIDARPVA